MPTVTIKQCVISSQKHSGILTQDAHTSGGGTSVIIIFIGYLCLLWAGFCVVYGVYWLKSKPGLFLLPEIVNMDQHNLLCNSSPVLGNAYIFSSFRKIQPRLLK